ncbi:DUF4097 family beta strand repeat-containing protein [Microbacterium oxydans]|uniref:DUF4097 domain-containing protein n=1 Tax=Microbacterium oxydans TaxID=82380 RepID=A0A0F0LA38_9MICO|nr:DUF4097 family beta strand repeat-containing protein [Microbacterium oxydans]KJL29998.1 hypothetical protein RS83_01138 [Microbacterium oxydans]
MTTENDDVQGGHTPLTPPPLAEPQQPTPAQQADAPRRTSGATAIMVVTAVVGGIALLGSGGAAAAAATGSLFAPTVDRVFGADHGDSLRSVDVAGIDGIDVDVDAGNMRIEFGDVDEAQLSVTNGRGADWTFELDGGTLQVHSPDFRFGWWFGSWFGDDESAVLTLPESLRDSALDADLTLDAGSLDVVGDFGALDVDVNAGALDVQGAAERLGVEMSAGRADVLLDGVTEADLGVSAGNLTAELTGAAPTRTSIDVSAGSVDLTVPNVAYTIEQDISAGSLDAKVEQSEGARRTIEVTLAAGSVTVRPGR